MSCFGLNITLLNSKQPFLNKYKMKQNIIKASLLTFSLMVLLMVLYPLAMWGIAQLSPNQGNGFLVADKNQNNYYENIGQSFSKDQYFHGRPSTVDYNAAGSGASNKGSNNEEYLQEVEKRLNDFLQKNPTVKKEDIPVDLITASGSGLDPNISVQGAIVQIDRIAKIRDLDYDKVNELIQNQIEKPLLGGLGPNKINVLKLNIELDKLSK